MSFFISLEKRQGVQWLSKGMMEPQERHGWCIWGTSQRSVTFLPLYKYLGKVSKILPWHTDMN